MKKINYWIGFCLSSLLSACMVGPDYHQPKWPLHKTWHEESSADSNGLISSAGSEINSSWWTIFQDEQLNHLVLRAVAQNTDRAVAKARILQARGGLMTATAALLPQISGNVQGVRGNQAQNLIVKPFNAYTASFDAAYEIDLFGGNRRNREAAKANLQAAHAAYQDVTISLIAEVVRDYALFRQFQSQLDFTKRIAKAQEKLYQLTQQQYKMGMVSRLDVLQAQTQLKNTQANIPALEQQVAATGYALSVLLGENPGPLNDELNNTTALVIPDSLTVLDSPAAIIARRPDVRVAERQLASRTALQGVAISQLYPNISLASLAGYAHNTIGASGHVWSVSGNLVAALLDIGNIRGQIKTAKGKKKEALAQYHHTVLQALADVETSLNNVVKEHERLRALSDATDSAQQTLILAKKQYQIGSVSLINELQAEQNYYSAQNDLIASQTNLIINMAALHKALGIGIHV